MRRLLAHHYVGSVEVLLGPAAALAAEPPSNAGLGAFDQVAATESPLPPSAIDAYEASALAIANAVLDDRDTLAATVPCVADGPFDDACFAAVAQDFGRLAWRRPLTEDEVDELTDLGSAVAAHEDSAGWDDGLRGMLLAMLQAPDFLYVVEVGEPSDDEDAPRTLTEYELASRLSFFLTGHTPTATLLDLADAGGLATEDDVRDVAWDLLSEPAAREQVGLFYTELFRLGDLEDKAKDTDLFPLWDEDTAASMRGEALRMVDDIVFSQADVLALLDTDQTFVDERVAAIYGIEPPDPPWSMVTLPADQDRAGILTTPAFLSATSFTTRNSPTRRGLFVQDRLLCVEIPPPPPDVDANLPEGGDDITLRQRLEQHMTDPACAACHALVDPVGFAFEGFDALGAARALDNGLPIDSSGDVAGLGTFGGAADLAGLLREDPRVPGCLVDNLFVYALGYSDTAVYADGLLPLHDEFETLEHDFLAVMVELSTSPLFSSVGAPK